jgi:hypothetical protein
MRVNSRKTAKAAATLLIALFIFSALPFAASAQDAENLENLEINTISFDGNALIVDVTDKVTGVNSILEIPLDGVDASERYITVRATDVNGNTSKAVKVPNPLYTPPEETPPEPGEAAGDGAANSGDAANSEITGDGAGNEPAGDGSETSSEGRNPFTPDGTGEVVDDVAETEGEKEFFTITTKDGNIYYLIIDRQRDSQNVYFLDVVTEGDLLPLAAPEPTAANGGVTVVTPPPPTPESETPTEEAAPPPISAPEAPAESGGSGRIILIVLVVAAVGGIGYYVKIVKPKRRAPSEDEDDVYEDRTPRNDESDEWEDDDTDDET